MDNFLILIIEFFKTGLFAVGGGLAAIPFLVEIGNKYGFFTYQELLTMIGVSESTPGAIGINMATYVGIKVEGFWGGVVATLSLVAPSIIIIILIARVINKYRDSIYVESIMNYLKPMSLGFILAAVAPILLGLFKNQAINKYLLVGIFALVFFIREKLPKIHPAFIILAGFVAGILMDLL